MVVVGQTTSVAGQNTGVVRPTTWVVWQTTWVSEETDEVASGRTGGAGRRERVAEESDEVVVGPTGVVFGNDPGRLMNGWSRAHGGTAPGNHGFGGVGAGGGGVAPPGVWLPMRSARRPRSFVVSSWPLPTSPSTRLTVSVASL